MFLTTNEPIQTSLDLKIDDKGLLDLFIKDKNELLVESLKQACTNRPHELFYIYGQEGCGKTHLLTALYRNCDNKINDIFYIDLKLVKSVSHMLLFSTNPYKINILDNIDAIAQDDNWELALFAFFNRWSDTKEGTLICSANNAPSQINFNKKDLNTRFSQGICFHMENLDEKGCIRAIQLRAKKRGFVLNDNVCSFLIKNLNRHMPTLIQALDKLDKLSLNEKHNITIPFIKKYLNNL